MVIKIKKMDIDWKKFHELDKMIFVNNQINEDVFNDLERDGLFFIVDESNIDQPLGYISMKILGRTGKVSRHGILPDYRRKGLGQQLLDFGLKWLKDEKCKEAFLYIESNNVPGLILYSSYEFKTAQTIYQFKIDYTTLNKIKISDTGYSIKELAINDIDQFIEVFDQANFDMIKSYVSTIEKNILIGLYYKNEIRGLARFTPAFPGMFPIYVSYPDDIYPLLQFVCKKWALKKFDYIIITFESQVSLYRHLKKDFEKKKFFHQTKILT